MAAVRMRVLYDQPNAYQGRLPSSFSGYRPGQPAFSVQRAKHLVDVYESRLQFHDQQVRSPRMPRQLVNRAAFTVDRERHLSFDDPPGICQHERREALRQNRVPPAQEPVQFSSAPPRVELCSYIQGGSDPPWMYEQSSTRGGEEENWT